MLYIIVDEADLGNVLDGIKYESDFSRDSEYVRTKIDLILQMEMPFAVHLGSDDQGILIGVYESGYFDKLLGK